MQALHFPYKKYSSRLSIPCLILVLLISLATPTSSCTEQEEASLLQLLAGLSKDAGLAKSWQGGTDCCKWEGITCNRNRTVVEVSLASRGLEGRITPSLSTLTGLQHLDLSYNLLSGDLPLELLSSSSIIVLDFRLDDWLHNRDDDASTFLDWSTRLKIAQGASRGLSYIHNVCKPHIVHRDIKSSNILLDKEFKAYVADFGLSRLILPNKTHVTTELVGTLGYIPPEYAHGWVATLRGDIYSFGVVLLELLTGIRPVQVLSTSKELVSWVMEMRSQGKQIEVLDATLHGTGHEEQMLKMLEVACKCVNHDPFMRPTIKEVVSYLESIDAGLQKQKLVETECS